MTFFAIVGIITVVLAGTAVLTFVAAKVTLVPDWFERHCIRSCDRIWFRKDHPGRPAWVWWLVLRHHDWDYGHLPEIRAWQAEHTVKKHWWSRRVIL